MFAFIWMCVIGLIAGAIAKLIMGNSSGGMITTMLLGIAGSVVAGFIGRVVGLYGAGQRAGFVMSVLGAILLLALYRMFRRTTA